MPRKPVQTSFNDNAAVADAALHTQLRAAGKMLPAFWETQDVILPQTDMTDTITLLGCTPDDSGKMRYLRQDMSRKELADIINTMVQDNLEQLALIADMAETPPDDMTMSHADALGAFQQRYELEETMRLLNEETGLEFQDGLAIDLNELLRKEFAAAYKGDKHEEWFDNYMKLTREPQDAVVKKYSGDATQKLQYQAMLDCTYGRRLN